MSIYRTLPEGFSLMFRDENPEMVSAWRKVFDFEGPWDIEEGNILSFSGDAAVFFSDVREYMNEGIGLAYRNHFGLEVLASIRAATKKHPDGILDIGEAIVVQTGHEKIPHLIVAPAKISGAFHPGGVFEALQIALLHALNESKYHILCPGRDRRCLETATLMRRAVHEVCLRTNPQYIKAWQLLNSLIYDESKPCPEVLTRGEFYVSVEREFRDRYEDRLVDMSQEEAEQAARTVYEELLSSFGGVWNPTEEL